MMMNNNITIIFLREKIRFIPDSRRQTVTYDHLYDLNINASNSETNLTKVRYPNFCRFSCLSRSPSILQQAGTHSSRSPSETYRIQYARFSSSTCSTSLTIQLSMKFHSHVIPFANHVSSSLSMENS